MSSTFHLIITCEHGGNEIPDAYKEYFAGHESVLASHLGHDPGALELARKLAEAGSAPLFYATTSRLLVELNRSVTNRRTLFSKFISHLSPSEKQAILAEFYVVYRTDVEAAITEKVKAGDAVLHLSIHSFTPVLNGKNRNADLGFLYDPRRKAEKRFARSWAAALSKQSKSLRIRFNYPYLGTADGFTTYLRQRFPEEAYLGLELEVNQKFPLGKSETWQVVQESLVLALQTAVHRFYPA